MLTEKSISDFDHTKKAEYYDKNGFYVADKANKEKLNTPVKIKDNSLEEKE